MSYPSQWIGDDLASFLCAAAFVLLGALLVSQPERPGEVSRPKHLYWLAAFALVHGVGEWLATWVLVEGSGNLVLSIGLAARTLAYLFLFEFGRRLSISMYRGRLPQVVVLGAWLYLVILVPAAMLLLFSSTPATAADIWIRYSAALFGAVLTAAGLWRFVDRNRVVLASFRVAPYLRFAALGMLLYGIAAGLIVSPAGFFPASWLNQESFLRVVGLPIEAVRAGLALTLALTFGLVLTTYSRHARQSLQDAVDTVNRRNQQILEAAGDAIIELDPSGRIAFANPEAFRATGYSESELMGESYAALVGVTEQGPPAVGVEKAIAAALTTVRRETGSGSFRRKDGTVFPVDFTCTPIRENDDCVGVVLTFRDVTERERLTGLLRDTQAMARIGGWELDLKTNSISWTDAVYSIHELPVGSTITLDRAISFYHPDSRPVIREAVEKAIRTGEGWDLELKLVSARGRLLWVRAIGEAHRRDGDVCRLSGTFQDITERKVTEKALRDSTDFYELILDSVPVHIAYVNDQERIAYVNKSYEEWFQTPRTAILGKRVKDITTAESFKKIEPRLAKVLKGEEVAFNVTVNRDGEAHELDVTYLPHLDRSGDVIGFFSVVQDMTEHKQLEARLIQAQKMEAVGQLTGGIAHDFNNLLSVIVGNLQLLERPLREQSDLHKKVKTATRAAVRGADLTRRLLVFSRREHLEPEVLNLNTLVLGLDELFNRTLGEGIEVTTEFAADLWPVKVDPGQMENALLNLAINARDAMPGGGKLTIETSNIVIDENYVIQHPGVMAGDYVVVAVSDTGTGIEAEVLEQVFEPFFTTKEVGKGSGLGLSMVYGFAEQSGGHTTIYSEPGHGTTVRVHLPRGAAIAPQRIEESGSFKFIPRGSETILVVEDEDDVRDTVVRLLMELGYGIVAAKNGEEALEIIESGEDIDLLFTDVMMPGGMHGPVLAAKALEARPELKVLFTSGYAESAVMHRGMLVGSSELIGKPYKTHELALKIRLVLDKGKEQEAALHG